MRIYNRLLKCKKEKGAGYFVLIDPDSYDRENLVEMALRCQTASVDALLIGGSLLFEHNLDTFIKKIKDVIQMPVIIFPGSKLQLSKYADAILFLSLISGRNPNYLIGDQVIAAPHIKELGIEPISTGYMLIESGETTSAEFMSGTRPIPRKKTDIAVAHALAAEYLGMKFVYLEAGSGARYPVPDELISAVNEQCKIPLIVGGGLRTPEQAHKKVMAGASYIVTGNILENNDNSTLIREFADAVHIQRKT